MQTPRTAMLNIHRLGSFKYDVRDALARSPVEESLASSILANIIAKSSRISVKDAKEYIKDLEQKEMIDHKLAGDLCSLLDRYSKYR